MEPARTEQSSAPSNRVSRLIKGLDMFEDVIVCALIVMMGLVVLVSTLELGWLIVKDLSSPPFVLLTIHQFLEILGLFLLILIGIELLATMKAYFVEHTLHVEIVVQVALISIARKIIVLEVQEPSATHLFGFAGLLLALAATYWVEMKVRTRASGPAPLPKE